MPEIHFKNAEIEDDPVSSISEHTADVGIMYQIKFYNFDAIIAVGYREYSY